MREIITGSETATGSAMNIEVGFLPSRVELTIGHNGMVGFWDRSMWEGTFQAQSVGYMVADTALLGASLPYIGSTDTQIATPLAVMCSAESGTEETEVTIPAVAAGTAFTATTHDIVAGTWGIYVIEVDGADGTTFAINAGAANATTGYATEALAIAALPTVTAGEAAMGIITVEATAGAIFNATTDALAGGSSGTPAASTNYYPGYALITGGISLYGDAAEELYEGFTIGADAMINTALSQIHWKAYR